MPARVQVVVEAKDASSGVLRAITGQMGALGGVVEELTAKNINWGNVTERAATMVIDGIKESISATLEYADSVRELSLISGQSTEETSRFIQVLDDYKISSDDALLATKALTKEGLTPSIDTLAKLSDEYLSINEREKQNEFIIKNLGRSGLQWVDVLEKGSAALLAQGDAIDESLILTQDAVNSAREYEVALDNWNDSIQGLKISIGNELLPVLTTFINRVSEGQRAAEIMTEEGLNPANKASQEYRNALQQAHEEQIAATEAIVQNSTALTENAESAAATAEEIKKLADETTNYYKGLISDTQSAQREIDRYVEAQQEAAETIAQADADLASGAISLDEHGKILAENTAKLKENEQAHKDWAAQTVFAFAQARAAADGQITKGEGEILIQVGQQLDLFDEKTAVAMQNVNEAFDSLDTENAVDVVHALEDALHDLTDENWVINISTQTSGSVPSSPGMPGTGGGGQAIGGEVYAGQTYTVGEAGAEPFMPAMNGRILGHSEALHAMSLGGGGAYNFYGNVTLQISEDAGAGFMEMR